MTIICPELLATFRVRGTCPWCGHFTSLDPHHVFARGMGAGKRLDIRINLIGLCRSCHTDHHWGSEPILCDLMALVAAREACLQSDIEEAVRFILRLPKDASPRLFKQRLRDASEKVKELVGQVFTELLESQ